jgi:hypothetical protein
MIPYMKRCGLFIAGLIPAALAADPRGRVSDYPASAALREYDLGAEYSGRTFFSGGKAYDSGDFIVVEVGIFPRLQITPKIAGSNFALAFNGKKELVYAQSPGAVAVSQRMRPWGQRRGVVVGAGPVIIGAPDRTPRFPGDREAQPRLPNPPRAPEPDHQTNVEREAPPDFADLVNREALPDGTAGKPVRGYLYFPYSGKLTKLRKIDLIVVDEKNRGSVTIKK